MEHSLRNILDHAVSLVVCIRVESVVRSDVVLQQGLQVFLAIFAEQECIDPRTEPLEGKVRGRE